MGDTIQQVAQKRREDGEGTKTKWTKKRAKCKNHTRIRMSCPYFCEQNTVCEQLQYGLGLSDRNKESNTCQRLGPNT